MTKRHSWNYRYRLTQIQADEIREKWHSTKHIKMGNPERHTYKSLMIEYQVGRNTIWKILTNQSYVRIPE
jgi:hypothetical protein